jgi:hypothetical protein
MSEECSYVHQSRSRPYSSAAWLCMCWRGACSKSSQIRLRSAALASQAHAELLPLLRLCTAAARVCRVARGPWAAAAGGRAARARRWPTEPAQRRGTAYAYAVARRSYVRVCGIWRHGRAAQAAAPEVAAGLRPTHSHSHRRTRRPQPTPAHTA